MRHPSGILQENFLPWGALTRSETYPVTQRQQNPEDARTPPPRFLYRVHSSASSGFNSSMRISPIAVTLNRYIVPLEGMHSRIARDMLEKHLQWIPDSDDQFTSWTSSLLFALQRAIYDTAGQEEVYICIIDTFRMRNISFYHAATLLKVYEIPSQGKLQPEYFTAEYLTTGTVLLNEVSSTSVRFSDFVNGGLYELAPHLRPKSVSPPLCGAVADIRRTHFRVPMGMSQRDIDIARSLAQDVSGAGGFALFLSLLSLQERKVDDQLFLKAVRESYCSTGLEWDFFAFDDSGLRFAVDQDVVQYALLGTIAGFEKGLWEQRRPPTPIVNDLFDVDPHYSDAASTDSNIDVWEILEVMRRAVPQQPEPQPTRL